MAPKKEDKKPAKAAAAAPKKDIKKPAFSAPAVHVPKVKKTQGEKGQEKSTQGPEVEGV